MRWLLLFATDSSGSDAGRYQRLSRELIVRGCLVFVCGMPQQASNAGIGNCSVLEGMAGRWEWLTQAICSHVSANARVVT